YTRWMGQSFVKHGFRALIPAAPCHLDRSTSGFSGAKMFWSSRLVVAGLSQWLAEIRGLLGGLRQQGGERIGPLGYHIRSLAAGLAATLWKDLDFVALLAPVGHHLKSLPLSPSARRFWPWMVNVPAEDAALLDRWSAPGRRPLGARVLFLMTLFDVLQPHSLQQTWWETWNQPPR